MRSRILAVLAWVWAVLIYTSVVLTFSFGLLEFDLVGALTGPLLASLGALLVTLRPGNPIGFLLLMMATGYGIAINDVVIAVSETPWGTGPGWVALLFATNLFAMFYILPPIFLLLLFPTGRPPDGWRWLLRAVLGFTALALALTLLVPTWGSLDGLFAVDNPLVPYSEADLGPVVGSFFETGMSGLIGLFLLLSVVSLIVRYRRAGAVERAQIRWFLYSGSIFVVSFIVTGVVSNGWRDDVLILDTIFYLSVLTVPVSVAIAILRHRLLDIDVIIRRTLQYGVLTAILGGLYFGSVLLFQTLLGGLMGRTDSPPVVIVTTLILAALFNPLRVRVQRFIDRRFYRSKVDAERALARFAALARDEVELAEIRRALFDTVEGALQPERVGLWLTSGEREEAGSG